jgi:hypothetical protein
MMRVSNKGDLTMLGVIVSQVRMAVADMSNADLAVLNICAQLDQDPRNRAFDYDKVSFLFTDNNGTKMHTMTKEALAIVVNERLAPKIDNS